MSRELRAWRMRVSFVLTSMGGGLHTVRDKQRSTK